jgi:hypothetical protein
MLMQLLVIVALIIAILWPAYWLLTRPQPPIRRRWSWRRLYIRTLDKLLLSSSKSTALVILSPLLLYMAASGLLGLDESVLGLAIAITASVALAMLAGVRAAKWMARTTRPMDEARARWQDRILSREYRSCGRSQRAR